MAALGFSTVEVDKLLRKMDDSIGDVSDVEKLEKCKCPKCKHEWKE